MNGMIDWWTVPGGRWGVEGLDFKVELRPDELTRPNGSDEYDEDELDAFDGGDWRYVEVTVTPVDPDFTDLIQHRTYLTGVEWGEFPSRRIDRLDLNDDQIKGLVVEAVVKMRAKGLPVTTDGIGDFSPAPF